MSHLSEKMQAAIVRAAERELKLRLGKAPIDDLQIAGSAYDVHVEGTYLGWTSKEGKAEARALYDATPSRLRPLVESARKAADKDLSFQVGLAVKKCREIAADMLCGGVAGVTSAVTQLRAQLELLHEHVLNAEDR